MALSIQILSGLVQLSGNPVEIIVSGGSQPAGTTDYQLLLKIVSQDGKLEGAPLVDAITPDASGKATFDISGVVDQPVDISFQYPPSGPVAGYPTRAFSIQVQAGESYFEQGVLVENWAALSDVFQILKGGSNPRTLALWNSASTDFYQRYIAQGRFLTPRPWGESVIPGQPVKLWFMVTENCSAVFCVRLVYLDRTETTYSSAISLSTDLTYEFNCNPLLLGMAETSPAGSKPYYFDVWLESGGAPISDTRRFHFDLRFIERPFYLFYTNSMGGVDDSFFGGHAIESVSSENTVVYKPQLKTDTVYNPTLKVVSKAGKNIWKLNTGYRPTNQIPDYRDLLVAKQMWLVYPNITQSLYLLTPVILESSQVELVNHKAQLTQISIEVSEAHFLNFGFDSRIEE